MDQREFQFAFWTGAAASVLWFFVLKHLSLLGEGELVATVVAIPVLFVVILFFIGRFLRGKAFHSIAKFLMVGMVNTGIDFFVFDTLIVATSNTTGLPVLLFKSISFVCALFNSYELNRLWTFGGENGRERSREEFVSFAAITLVGFVVNVGTTFLIVSTIHAPFGLSQIRWDNVAAAAATGLNLIWNFAGYRFFVFTERGRSSDLTSPHVV